jgi:hypothetical protein
MISAAALAIALYSASVLDHDIVGCFLALHETKFDPRKMAKPPVERRSSIHPAQSAYAKPLTSMDGDLVIYSPKSMVPFTYHKIRFAAVRCNVVGACKY